MMFDIKIIENEDGSALPSVLIIIVIVSLFVGVVLSGIYLQNQIIQKDVNEAKTRYAAEAGIYQFLSGTTFKDLPIDTTTNLFGPDSIKTNIRAKSFGGFFDVTSEVSYKEEHKKVRAILGEQSSSAFNNAILLGDTTSQLSVTGETSITGDILTGRLGVKKTNFKGRPFSGTIEGEINEINGPVLPEFRTSSLHKQIKKIENLFPIKTSMFSIAERELSENIDVEGNDTVYVNESTKWVSSDIIRYPEEVTFIVAGNLQISGNYEFGIFNRLIVRDTLSIEGDVKGQHLLLYAGKHLEISGQSNFSCNCFSGDKISIRERAYLSYPSFVYTQQEAVSENTQESVIEIQDQAVVDGMVLYPVGQSSFTSNRLRIIIGEQALVRGAVYSMNQTELRGTVHGSVLSHQFYYYESPTAYINWLKDSEVHINKRPSDFVIPLGFSDNPKYKVLKWIEE